MIRFYLNGQYKQVTDLNPNTTVLEYLRLHEKQRRLREWRLRRVYHHGAALACS